jgi:hypothetical protein
MVVMAAAVGAAWLAAVAHESRPHIFCARHQAFEERADEPRRPSVPYVAAEVATRDAGRHARCAVIGQHRDVDSGAPAPAAPAEPAPRRALAIDQTADLPIPLLALAPKVSPPDGIGLLVSGS